MSQMRLRLHDSLHEAVNQLAKQENVSANRFIPLAVAEKVSALMTLEWPERRAVPAPTAARFAELLAQAPDIEPSYEDV